MDDEGIKSALELAMERISALPQLTPQEIAEQKEKENAPIGMAIAVKYLGGGLSEAELPAELTRYEGERQRLIRRTMLSCLCGEINFKNTPQNVLKALRGAEAVAPHGKGRCEEASKVFTQILDEFEEVREKGLAEFAALARRRMKNLGIDGSAVRPNMNEDERWKQELSATQQAFEPKLEIIRKNLLEALLRG